jgi:hypothetical protein
MLQKEANAIAKCILPTGILDYFDFDGIEQTPSEFQIFLSERNRPPEEYRGKKITSKGFFDEIKVVDFPIRGKNVYLMVKRRRWLDESTGYSVFRNWDMVAKGTRMTKDFASFLKVIAGYQAREL